MTVIVCSMHAIVGDYYYLIHAQEIVHFADKMNTVMLENLTFSYNMSIFSVPL